MSLIALYILLDQPTLSSLSRVNKLIHSELKNLVHDQYFYYLRTQNIVGRSLKKREGVSWEACFFSFREEVEFNSRVIQNELAIEVLREIGHRSLLNKREIDNLVLTHGTEATIRLVHRLGIGSELIGDSVSVLDRVTTNENDILRLFSLGCNYGYTSLVSLTRRYVSDIEHGLSAAIRRGHVEIAKYLILTSLESSSLDKSWYSNNLAIARARGHTEMCKLLEQTIELGSCWTRYKSRLS